jgi:TATA-box binding protein (TBP) (component of TFIID and TFIIIB)
MNNEIILQQKQLDLLPKDIIISTITLHCKIDIKFNILNIINHWPKNDPLIIICNNKKKNSTKNSLKKKNNMFFNQVPINITISNKVKPISIKLFTNGTIHLTGCKTINNVIDALTVLFDGLRAPSEISYVDDIEMLTVENIKNIKIAMINSNFTIPFNIDRVKLFDVLKKDKITCSFDSLIHAGVIIRHTTSSECNDESKPMENATDLVLELYRKTIVEKYSKIITILVFEKGSVIITGARNYLQILSAYEFINKYILSNYKSIKKEYINISKSILRYFQDDEIAKLCCM